MKNTMIRFIGAFLIAVGSVSAQPPYVAVAQPRYCYTTYQNIARRDTVTNTASWNGYNATEQVINTDHLFDVNPVISFLGDGNKLNRVGMIVMGGDAAGNPNYPFNPNDFEIHFTFFESVTDYTNDPFRLNPPRSNYSHVFNTSNLLPGWQNVVGFRTDSYGTWNLYYFQIDVSALGIATVSNRVQLVGMMVPGLSGSGVVADIQPGTMSPLSGPDYFAAWLGGSNWYGPAPMDVVFPGYYGPNVAGYVSTRRTVKRCDAMFAALDVACIHPDC